MPIAQFWQVRRHGQFEENDDSQAWWHIWWLCICTVDVYNGEHLWSLWNDSRKFDFFCCIEGSTLSSFICLLLYYIILYWIIQFRCRASLMALKGCKHIGAHCAHTHMIWFITLSNWHVIVKYIWYHTCMCMIWMSHICQRMAIYFWNYFLDKVYSSFFF